MKKIFSQYSIAIVLFYSSTVIQIYAQEPTTIGLSLIQDKTTNSSKSFAFFELFVEKKYTRDNKVLVPILVDYCYATNFGIDGVFTTNNIKLNLYKDAKLIETITCENDWKILTGQLDNLFEKNGFQPAGKISKVDEGKPSKVYEKWIANNLPGSLEMEVPRNNYSDEIKLKTTLSFYDAKNPYEELKELHGRFSDADIKNTKFFKFKDVPDNLKDAVKPLVWPAHKTLMLPVSYLMYGNLLLTSNDYAASQHCYLQALEASSELIGSVKDKANLRAYIFDKLAILQSKLPGKRLLYEKLFKTCALMNRQASLSEAMLKEDKDYYTNVEQVKKICMQAEQNARSARANRLAMFTSAVSTGLAKGAMSTGGGDMYALSNSLSMSESTMRQGEEQQRRIEDFKNELRTVASNIDGELFVTDANGTESASSRLGAESLYFLSQYPDEVRESLEEYAEDKPLLKTMLIDFYKETDKSSKGKILKKLFFQFSKIESAITNFEVRGLAVSEKYLNQF